MKQGLRGFTLVEVVVIIVVIAILIGIASLGLSRYQAEGRDTRRATSATVLAEALEKYYDKSGEYPSCNAISGTPSSIVAPSGALPGINTEVFKTPSAATDVTNSIQCADLTPASTTDYFAYLGDGSADCSGTNSCLQFVLKYKEEVSNTVKSIESRRKTPLATAGTPVLTSSSLDFDSVNLSWTATQNTTGYTLQRSTASNFSSVVATPLSTTTTSVTDLTPGVQYFFRVAPTLNGDTGNWSNIISPTMLSIGTVSGVTASPTSATQIQVNWAVLSNPAPTSYQVRYSTASNFSGATQVNNLTGTNTTISGLTTGTLYYFQVRGFHAKDTGDWSTTVSATPIIPAPAGFSVSASGTLTGTANVTCTLGTPYYYWYAGGAFWVEGAGHRTVTYTLNYGQSVTLSVRARCDASGQSSAWTNGSNTISATRSVPAPTWTRLQYVATLHTWLEWTNVCSGPNEVLSNQGGYSSGWNAPLYNGSGSTGGRTYNNYWLGEFADWSSYGTTRHYVRTTCNGVLSPNSSEGVINF